MKRIRQRLFFKASYRHVALVHTDEVAPFVILRHIQIPVHVARWIHDAAECHRSGAVGVQRVGALKFFAPAALADAESTSSVTENKVRIASPLQRFERIPRSATARDTKLPRRQLVYAA